MELHDSFVHGDKTYRVVYRDADSFVELPREKCRQHLGVCFYDDKIVLGFHSAAADQWALIGGKVEPGETIEETLVREVREESNMRVLRHVPIGYQEVLPENGEAFYQLRSYCAVEPLGPFTHDPAGAVSRLEFVPSTDFKRFIDWGAIGDHLVARALEIHRQERF